MCRFIRGGTFETRQVSRFQQLDIELAPYEGLADKLEEQRVRLSCPALPVPPCLLCPHRGVRR